jgi:S1-C subfamily serine protease
MSEYSLDLHKKVIYPIVQVRAQDAGGSGTIVYSQSNDDGETYDTFVLTNWHVVQKSIKVEDKYQPVYGRKMPWETRQTVEVRKYIYRNVSWLDSTESVEADITMWDKDHDLALLYLRSEKEFPYVANIYDADKIEELRMQMPLIAVGCSLLHKPLPSDGKISSLDETVENLRYFMSNTMITFGNSGGAIFQAETLEFLGIPSRLDVAAFGFGGDPQNFLNYFIPIHRIRDVLGKEWHYEFIFDPDFPKEKSEELRAENRDAVTEAWEERFKKERGQAMGLS